MEAIIQDVIDRTRASVDELIKAASYIPEEKKAWSPGGKARSTIEILRECAGFPGWISFTLANLRMPNDQETADINPPLQERLGSYESVVQAIKDESLKLYNTIEKFPLQRLDEKMSFPWGTYSSLGVMGFHYWNNTYHCGQFNYIQLLLGDNDMHL